jgi:hypothetical protein
MPYPWSAFDVLTAADLNAAIGASLYPDRCFAYQGTTATTLTTAVAAALAMDAELFDTSTMHSTSVNPSRITTPSTGYYKAIARVGFASNATGYRMVEIRLNGTSIAQTRVPAISGAATVVECTCEHPLAAGQYLEVWATQTSGGNLATALGYGITGLNVARASN